MQSAMFFTIFCRWGGLERMWSACLVGTLSSPVQLQLVEGFAEGILLDTVGNAMYRYLLGTTRYSSKAEFGRVVARLVLQNAGFWRFFNGIWLRTPLTVALKLSCTIYPSD